MTKTKFGLTGNQLKLFAMLAMTLDHIGGFLLPQYVVLRYIGRLAMPIFAWMIAEGCEHTRNRFRYLITVLLFGVASQVIAYIATGTLHQNILITFSMAILMIYVVDLANRKKGFITLCLMGAVFTAITYVCLFLPQDLPVSGFSIDYSIFGVMLPVAIYLGRTKQEKLLLAAMLMLPLAIIFGYNQWIAYISLPLLSLYNGTRGKVRMKYLFYFYYPLHLAAIYGIAYLLKYLKQ